MCDFSVDYKLLILVISQIFITQFFINTQIQNKNSKQKLNNYKCRCECKKPKNILEYAWDPNTWACECNRDRVILERVQ